MKVYPKWSQMTVEEKKKIKNIFKEVMK